MVHINNVIYNVVYIWNFFINPIWYHIIFHIGSNSFFLLIKCK